MLRFGDLFLFNTSDYFDHNKKVNYYRKVSIKKPHLIKLANLHKKQHIMTHKQTVLSERLHVMTSEIQNETLRSVPPICFHCIAHILD